jgi:hypothetical protein
MINGHAHNVGLPGMSISVCPLETKDLFHFLITYQENHEGFIMRFFA